MIGRSLLAVTAVLAVAAPAWADYASVNGLKMYYEVQGSGRPLVMLHGGVCTIEVCLGKLRPSFAKARRTIAIEQQGHGRTADIDRPLSYDQMAADTAALLRQLKVSNADFIGYSMGGGIALRIAMRHPDLVRKVVVIGTPVTSAGLVPGLMENFKNLKAEDIPQPFRDAYANTAPDPTKWPALVGKIKNLMLETRDLRPEELQSVQAPTLVMIGDQDIVLPEHAVEMFRLLPRAQLAVLPGSSHFAPMDRSDWIASMTRAFLNAPMPKPQAKP
jgi:pimeloyl-ACP methyl ester carboxylesterase